MSCRAGVLIKGVLCTHLGSKGQTTKAIGPISARRLCYAMQKQLSMAATTWVIWLCTCKTVGWCLSVALAFIVRKEFPLL